ncbi:MAG: AAA family ATPase [Candidatus Moraniibacteriota bacterium]|nr:MAG: AAA family ATPase [Candidatus Moranbacteria bacterium]
MNVNKPLAERMRPQKIEDLFGQEHLLGKGEILHSLIKEDKVPSLILWGPPGTGKTTLARIIAKETSANFVQLSAINAGVKDIRKAIEEAESYARLGAQTILFIDEVHRFNKSQQDAFLPSVEDGTIIFIGATTENPSFEVNSALLSRSRVFVLESLTVEALEKILEKALKRSKEELGVKKVDINKKVREYLCAMSNGDARTMLNALEIAVDLEKKENSEKCIITEKQIEQAFQKTNLFYDKGGEEHYNLISALHKSMRGSDADAALYYLARMLEGGEDPLYIARRVVRFASEDIGLANSFALPQAIAAYDACRFIGMPECGVNLAQAVVYMAKSKKSISIYAGYSEAMRDVKELGNVPVPLHLRNASTKLMKKLNYGKDYKYTPLASKEENDAQDFLPKELNNKKYIK